MATTTTTTPEPEELLEAAIVSRLAAEVSIPVEGVLTPATEGTEKRLSADTFVSVKVDQSSMDGDYVYYAPFTYAATIAVHYALADDASGTSFRDTCRAVRSALISLAGDKCAALSCDAFACDEFMPDSTSTSFDGGDNPVMSKSYSATIKGRSLATEA